MIHIFPAFDDDIRSLILAAFVVVEGDPFDQPGDFLGREPPFRDCGVHRGFIFAWAVCGMPTRAAGPDYQCLARIGRIEDVYGQT